jgi:hypothetical protein
MLHIFIALISCAVATAAYAAPSKMMLRISYGLAGATLASGCYLAWSQPAFMTRACVAGIVYGLALSFGTVMARRKLALRDVARAGK